MNSSWRVVLGWEVETDVGKKVRLIISPEEFFDVMVRAEVPLSYIGIEREIPGQEGIVVSTELPKSWNIELETPLFYRIELNDEDLQSFLREYGLDYFYREDFEFIE